MDGSKSIMETSFAEDTNWTKMLATVCVISENSDDILQCIRKGGDPNVIHMGRAPLHIAAERGRADFVNILLQNGAKASRFARDSETALHSTIRGASEGHCDEVAALECVRILCKHHHIIDIQDKQKQTPIYLAVKHGFWSIVSELIMAGASIDYKHQNTTVRQLIEKEKSELVEHVPQTEPIITIYQLGFGLLTSENDEEFVKYLDKFDLEANINERWYLGHTVLQVAVRHNLINSVTKLLDIGADPNVYSDFGWNALHIAVEVNSKRLCELLLQNGSHVDAKTAFKSETALHLAAKRSKNEIIKLLIDYKANIFIKNSDQVPIFTLLDHEIITEYLDKRISSRRTDNIQDSGSIIFDYSFLIPEPIPNDGLQIEMDCLLMLAILPKFWKFFRHPVLRSFLFLKWFRVYWLFYLQLVIYAIFVVILTIGVYLDVHIQRTGHEHEDHIPRHVILTLLFCILAWEIVKLILLPFAYFTNIGKCIEIAMYALVVTIHVFDFGMRFKQNVTAIIILLAMTMLTFHLGKHPRFAIFISIFLQVCKRISTFILLFIPLLIAFAFAFHMTFYDCDHTINRNCKENNTSTYGYPITLLKTVIMTQGEFNFTQIPFTKFGYIIFVLFIFFVVIVLVNLVNALAVSDTKIMIDDAELVNYVAQVHLYHKMEQVLLSSRKIAKCCRFCRIRPIKRGFRNCRHWIASKILLLSGRLPNQSLRVIFGVQNKMDPNVIDPCRRSCFKYLIHADFECFRITEVNNSCLEFHEFIRDACQILSKRETKSQIDIMKRRLEKLEHNLSKQLRHKDDEMIQKLKLQEETFERLEKRMRIGFAKQMEKLSQIERKVRVQKVLKKGKEIGKSKN